MEFSRYELDVKNSLYKRYCNTLHGYQFQNGKIIIGFVKHSGLSENWVWDDEKRNIIEKKVGCKIIFDEWLGQPYVEIYPSDKEKIPKIVKAINMIGSWVTLSTRLQPTYLKDCNLEVSIENNETLFIDDNYKAIKTFNYFLTEGIGFVVKEMCCDKRLWKTKKGKIFCDEVRKLHPDLVNIVDKDDWAHLTIDEPSDEKIFTNLDWPLSYNAYLKI